MRLSLEEEVPAGPSRAAPEMQQTGSLHTLVDPLTNRPKVYYGDGPFDASSSESEDERTVNALEDDEDEEMENRSLLSGGKPPTPGRAEMGDSRSRRHDVEPAKHLNIRAMAYVLIGLVSLSALIGIIAGFTYTGAALSSEGIKRITMDHVFNGTFYANSVGINWVGEAGDGVYSVSEGGSIKLVDLKSNTTRVLVETKDIKDEHGNAIYIQDWSLSTDMKFIMVKTDFKKQWRWSGFSNYYVHNLAEKTTYPLRSPSSPAKTAYAKWAPTGNAIAYVAENDLYIQPSATSDAKPIRVTSNGNASLFNGVPDWVYEEEIFSADFALWWSPDAKQVAYLSFDETAVPEFTFPIYNPTDNSSEVVPYTTEVVMKYPKPGYPNPLVTVHVFDADGYSTNHGDVTDYILTLNWEGRHAADDSVILEVAWVGNGSLIVKEVNRNADDGRVVLFDIDTSSRVAQAEGKVVRKLGKDGEEGDDGWIDNEQTISPVSSTISAFAGTNAYLDIVPTAEGFNHIALFSPASSGTPRFLTSGKWEVTGGIKGVDAKRGLVYFVAANPSTERHLYSVPLPVISSEKLAEPKALTDTSKPSFYGANLSPQAGFYVLNYQGPGVPWSKVVDATNSSFNHVLTTNERLQNITSQFEAGNVIHSTFEYDGFSFNVREIRPPRMDDSGRTKYPVLFQVYGGPNSQQVNVRFTRDWHHYIACGLQYIVVTVDGRGTGFKGRKLRNTVKGNLGFWETQDQIAAAKEWAKKVYVDPKRIGIWGWSYGGFMSSKVVEADAKVHSLAMAVAPVTSWRLYDSIYTERYMNLPAKNVGGYVNASISNVEGFKHVDFLLAHGSGDDNVHYANSAHLLDMFTQQGVRDFRFRMFTDSDHSINRRGGQREIYEYLTGFVLEKWGKGGRRRM